MSSAKPASMVYCFVDVIGQARSLKGCGYVIVCSGDWLGAAVLNRARRTSSAVFLAPSLRMTSARWHSSVR
jgi:hypothetical protein